MDYPDIPRALPDFILRAISGSAARPARETPAPLFNPWAPKVEGDGRLAFMDEDSEELAFEGPINQIKKLFSPQVTRTAPPKLADLPVLPAEPADEE